MSNLKRFVFNVACMAVLFGLALTPTEAKKPGGGGNGRRGGSRGVSIQMPVGMEASADSGPTQIESIRVKPRRNMATRHWTVVKQGDRIVSVIKGELRQRPLKSKSESDFDL